jgi:hypothetical protein
VRQVITLHGVAYAGGGVPVERVDVSIDDGASWSAATLTRRELRDGKQWAWTTWKAHVPLPRAAADGDVIVACSCATDAHGTSQPLRADEALAQTPSGYFYNPVHRVRGSLYLQGDTRAVLKD